MRLRYVLLVNSNSVLYSSNSVESCFTMRLDMVDVRSVHMGSFARSASKSSAHSGSDTTRLCGRYACCVRR